LPVARTRELLRRADAALREPLAQQREGMAPQREREARVVADDLLAFGGCGEGWKRHVLRGQRERRGLVHGERLPQRFAAMAREGAQRIGRGKRGKIATMEP